MLLAVELYEKDSDLTSYTNQATQVLCFTFIPQGLIGIFLGKLNVLESPETEKRREFLLKCEFVILLYFLPC